MPSSIFGAVTSTAAMRRPSAVASRYRRKVSTSGSSGMLQVNTTPRLKLNARLVGHVCRELSQFQGKLPESLSCACLVGIGMRARLAPPLEEPPCHAFELR